jgi:hypothetical protein
MYAMVCTRPDLAYPLSVLSRYVASGRYTDSHWEAAKRVLRYIRGTLSEGLTLGGPHPISLQVYCDASWVDDQSDRRSTQGYGCTIGGGLISWRATRSSSVALSSCEAELYALTMAAQELKWLCTLLEELGHPQKTPTIWCDNQSTIALVKDAGVFHSRTKHIDLRYHYIREMLERGQLQIKHVASEDNVADIFTKSLSKSAHRRLCPRLGLQPLRLVEV